MSSRWIASVLLGLILAVPGFANTIAASGAGALPGSAQDLSSFLSLTGIVGTLDFPNGVNMFKIDILNPADFSAFTVPIGAFGLPDPELFLFDAAGVGVYENDDSTASNTESCLPSFNTGNPCPSFRGGQGPFTAGIYYLAITRSFNSPLSNSGYIFSPLLSTDVAGPDLTAGGADPIAGWDNGVNSSPDFDLIHYDIEIRDTPVAAPELATVWTLAVTFAAAVLFRRELWAANRPQQI